MDSHEIHYTHFVVSHSCLSPATSLITRRARNGDAKKLPSGGNASLAKNNNIG